MTDIPNINDNQCFKWYLIRYIHPGDKNLEKIRKVGEGLARELDFKDMTFPVKKKTFSIFGYENKYPIYVPKNT